MKKLSGVVLAAVLLATAPARAELQKIRITMPAIATYYAPYLLAAWRKAITRKRGSSSR